jgi:hypothetical protein
MGCAGSKPKLLITEDDLRDLAAGHNADTTNRPKSKGPDSLRVTPATDESTSTGNTPDKDSDPKKLPDMSIVSEKMRKLKEAHDASKSPKGTSSSDVEDFGTMSPREPERFYGYMSKQGSVFRTWKKRFFILERGELSYFMRESNPGSTFGEQKMGTPFPLKGYSVVVEDGVQLLICQPGRAMTVGDSSSTGAGGGRGRAVSVVESSNTGKTRVMLLEPESEEDLNKWVDMLNEHIDYANKMES